MHKKQDQKIWQALGRPGWVPKALVVLVLVLAVGCDLFDPEDHDDNLPEVLVSYHEIGSLTAEQVASIYPSEIRPVLFFDITIYRVVYLTTDTAGEQVRASGVLLIPRGRDVSPMMSLHRTTIFHHDEVPSNVDIAEVNANLSPDGSDVQGPLLAGNTVWSNFAPVAASSGFITVMPDLLGWGESSDLSPPYLVSSSEAAVSLDMLRAVVELLETEEVGWNDELFVTGYSQGGSTAMSLLQGIQEDPDRQFAVAKASVGGGAYNLENLAAVILEQQELAFAPYYLFLLKSYRNIYFPTRHMNTFVVSPYDLMIESEPLFEGEYTAAELEKMFPVRTNELFLNSFRSNYLAGGQIPGPEDELRSAFMENDLSGFRVDAPLRIYHGEEDKVIPFSQAEQSVQNLEEAGSENVTLIPVERAGHRGAAEIYLLNTFLWFLFPGD